MKVSELKGADLDWAVAKAANWSVVINDGLIYEVFQPDSYNIDDLHNCQHISPSTDWAHGGPIIELEIIGLDYDAADGWQARDFDTQKITATGPTPLIAAMRCYVASKLGEEVEIPAELQGELV